jgi:hypothetical protein
MKLTKETLKRIIKEEMMQVMHEMDSNSPPLHPDLESLQKALETSGRFKIEPDQRNPEELSIETETDEWTASVDPAGDLILDFDNSNSEQIVGKDEALKFLLNL